MDVKEPQTRAVKHGRRNHDNLGRARRLRWPLGTRTIMVIVASGACCGRCCCWWMLLIVAFVVIVNAKEVCLWSCQLLLVVGNSVLHCNISNISFLLVCLHHQYHPAHSFLVHCHLFPLVWVWLELFIQNSSLSPSFFLPPRYSSALPTYRPSYKWPKFIYHYSTIYTCSFVGTPVCCRLCSFGSRSLASDIAFSSRLL